MRRSPFFLKRASTVVGLGGYSRTGGSLLLATTFLPWTVLCLALAAAVVPALAQSSGNSFAPVRFGDHVQVDIPRNWTYVDKRLSQDMNVASEAIALNLGLPVNQGDNIVLVAGNAMDGQRKTRATFRISVRVAKTATQAQMKEVAKSPPSEIQEALRPMAEEGVKALRQMPGVISYAIREVKIDRNENLTCMQASFEGVFGTGPRISSTWVCPVGTGTIKLSTSYDKPLQAIYEPILARVWRSLRVPPGR